jgi:hypothetical protein
MELRQLKDIWNSDQKILEEKLNNLYTEKERDQFHLQVNMISIYKRKMIEYKIIVLILKAIAIEIS